MQNMQNMRNMQNMQNVQKMQNMQNTLNMKSKVQYPHSISRTCLAQEFGLVSELLPCSKCLCACVLVRFGCVFGYWGVLSFILHPGYKTLLFLMMMPLRREQRLWSIWVHCLVNMEERQEYLNFQNGSFSSVNFFLCKLIWIVSSCLFVLTS